MLIRVRPAVRQMSDRVRFRRVSKHGGNTPKSGGEGSEALCVMIQRIFRLLKDAKESGFRVVLKMIEIRGPVSSGV
jgi:hypothetical protein